MEKVKIFCDESNFTGPDLLNEEQPVFTYATVCIAEDKAKAIIDELLTKLPLQSTRKEIKSNIITNIRGKVLVYDLLKQLSSNIKVSVTHKQFALACKFVETIIEPVIQKFNTLMYQTGMHLYAANVLFGMHNKGYNILKSFSNAVRKQDADSFIKDNCNDKIFGKFIRCNTEIIKEEITLLKSDKWSLDMTLTSLHTLLTLWYDEMRKPLEIIYDPSKPIADNMQLINNFIKRGEHIPLKYTLMGRETCFSYDLYAISEEYSESSAGIMLADLAAGFLKLGDDSGLHFYKHTIIAGSHENFLNSSVEETFYSAQLSILLDHSELVIDKGPEYWLNLAYGYVAKQHGKKAARELSIKHNNFFNSFLTTIMSCFTEKNYPPNRVCL